MAIFNVIIKSGHNIFSTSFALVTLMQVVTFYYFTAKNSKLTSKTKTSSVAISNKQFQQESSSSSSGKDSIKNQLD